MKTTLNDNITLVHHTVRFPNPNMPNKAEFFGLDPKIINKEIMTLGRLKLLPKQIWKDIYGEWKESPLYDLGIVRSQMQAFIDQFTFSYMNGLARALTDEKLAAFIEITEKLKTDFEEAKQEYIENIPELRKESKVFWKKKAHIFHLTTDQMEQAIEDAFPSAQKMANAFYFNVLHFEIRATGKLSMKNTENEEVIAKIKARNQVAQAAGKQLQDEVVKFEKEVIESLRNRTTEALSDLLEHIHDKQWNQKSINSTLKYFNDFKSLNFMNDKVLEGFINDKSEVLKEYKAKETKENITIETNLKNFLKKSVEELKNINKENIVEIINDFGNNTANRIINPF